MEQKRIRIKKCIDPDIKVGDKVRIADGSGLLHENHSGWFVIVEPYPELTGDENELKHITGTVVKTGIENILSYNLFLWGYAVDVLVQLGKTRFYTCSKFLHKIENGD